MSAGAATTTSIWASKWTSIPFRRTELLGRCSRRRRLGFLRPKIGGGRRSSLSTTTEISAALPTFADLWGSNLDLLAKASSLIPTKFLTGANYLQLLSAPLLDQISAATGARILLLESADPKLELLLRATAAPAAFFLVFKLAAAASPLSSQVAAIKSELLEKSWKISKQAMADKIGEEEERRKADVEYDPAALMEYYNERPLLVLSRLTVVAAECTNLLLGQLKDAASGEGEKKQARRAAELAAMLSRLGPTAVKIGQSLSTRPDLLAPAYIEALQRLQNEVEAFENEEAMRIIEEELGSPVEEIFSEMSAEPIAAASLGQVYRATLRSSGQTVAVKVQRPRVDRIISLDLYVLRSISITLSKLLPHLHTSSSTITDFLDHLASHIFRELDYTQEANNAQIFSRNMKPLPNVVVPKPVMHYTTKKILTTSWMDGDKLSKSNDGDSAAMVSVALNCYLCQLLENGFLHADPHPGNLLRTPDGRLCVLDFGLMLQITEEQRYALMECISHLAHSDYDKAAVDLINLGFLPSNPSEREQAVAMLPEVSKVLGRLVRGGGMQKMDVDQIVGDLTGLASDYGIVIPPYFLMILRAFSIIEGMGLKSNPNYVIIDECYPYICKQLLTDNSPRAQSIFKYFLYGQKEQLDARRVEAVFRGFQKYRTLMSSSSHSHGTRATADPPLLSSKQIISSLFAPEGSFIQELLLAELVRIVDALSREAMLEVAKIFVGVAPEPLTQLVGLMWPSTSPMLQAFMGGGRNSYRLSKEDEEAIELVRRIWSLMGSGMISVPTEMRLMSTTTTLMGMSSMMMMMPELAAGALTVSTRFWLMLMHRKALRLADDLDGTTNSLTYWNKDPAAFARHIQFKAPQQQHHRLMPHLQLPPGRYD